ncbi:hypothetical protein WDU94_015041 [Cyamophila willieti]
MFDNYSYLYSYSIPEHSSHPLHVQVMELFASMRDQSVKSQSQSQSTSNLTSLCQDISPSSSHFFEVYYIGKIRVSQRKVPESFIDEALDKFKVHEEEKRNRFNYDDKTLVQITDVQNKLSASSPRNELHKSAEALATTEKNQSPPPNTPPGRSRAGSVGTIRRQEQVEHNRTMLFLVGRTDLRLISPDKKQVLLHKQLKDVTFIVQGKTHGDHFGFISKEQGSQDSYIGYVFKCQDCSTADEVVGTITQAWTTCNNVKKEKAPVMSCDHCPMIWYHKLCSEIEGMTNDKKVQSVILKHVSQLPEEEQVIVQTKLSGAETLGDIETKEQNELLMMLLRAHCESKQNRHVHDTAENRHEFLNQYLGGSTIFMKAKRSLTSSFDQLLKRRNSRDDMGGSPQMVKEISLPMSATLCKEGSPTPSTPDTPSTPGGETRPRSATIGSESPNPNDVILTQATPHKGSPMSMMNIFLKVGNSPKTPPTSDTEDDKEFQTPRTPASWRQAIFNTVVTPSSKLKSEQMTKKDKADYRDLWRKAINQQVLLIRMDRENARLKANQEEATVKRIKLDYDNIGSCAKENMSVFETILNDKSGRMYNREMLMQAIRQGVPRSKRGEVWLFLAQQYCKKNPMDTSKFPNYNVSYEQLLKQLTCHQHAILLDLGRTFPTHPYYSSPLGPGQLSLFNVLKAYSLLDPELGYCQGLSFVAAVLLLHHSEEQAFMMLRHLMFRRGLRQTYLPDMSALQVQLYQFSRLLLDHYPDLHAHFDTHEVHPTLYAAPWLLTLFSSQFPLGFVTRVFDMVLVENPEIMFRVMLSLLGYHRENLLQCENFETCMDYLKTTIIQMDKKSVDAIVKQVFILDVSKQLLEYGVEYHVIQEQMAIPRPEAKTIKQLEIMNKALLQQNRSLHQQLEMATSNVQRLEQNRGTQMAHMNRLETELRSQEVTITALGNYINSLAYDKTEIVLPSDILRILSQINVLQRRKSEGITKPKTTTPRKVLKSTVSSPDFGDRVSRIFRRNNLQIFSESNDSETDDESLFTKSLSDTKGIATKLKPKQPLNTTQSSPNSLTRNGSLGRILTQEDIDSLKKIAEKQNEKSIERQSSINIEISGVDENANMKPEPTSSSLTTSQSETEGSGSDSHTKENMVNAIPNKTVPPPQPNNSLKTRKISTGYLRRSTSANNVPTRSDLKQDNEGINKGFAPFSINQKPDSSYFNSDVPSLSPPPNGNRKLTESLLNNNDVSMMINKKTDFANPDKLNSATSDLLFNRNNLLTR